MPPPSIRPEIIVKMTFPQDFSISATEVECKNFSDFLKKNSADLKNFAYYVGRDTPRFVLTIDPKVAADNISTFVVTANSAENRDELAKKIRAELENNFPNVRPIISFIQTGPPADYPVMLRVSGTEIEKVQKLASEVAEKISVDKNLVDVNFDWNEKAKILKVELDQNKLRSLGISSQAVKSMLYTEITGAKSSEFYFEDRTIEIDLRMIAADRKNLSDLKNLPIYLGAAGYVPLEQIAKISLDAEFGLIIRKNLQPTITVQANILHGTANDASTKALENISDLKKNLPLGYQIEAGGDIEQSEKSLKNLLVPIPAVIFIVTTLLMFQLNDGRAMILTLLTAPLGIIGVIFALIILQKSLGFVAELGVIALFGMIIRNSVILIDQIQQHLSAGEKLFDAIIDSAILRFRPIMLTAAAAILGMLPLMPSNFWGPLAVSISGGLLIATILTLLVLPVLYETFGGKK